MPSLPPRLWAELYFDGTWSDITADVRATERVQASRGLSSESSGTAAPTASSLALNNRHHLYAPRNPVSDLYGKIGRNTPLRWGYRTGSPYVLVSGVDGNLISTPSSSAFNVDDLDLRLDLAPETWPLGQNLAARYVTAGNHRSWFVQLAGTGEIIFGWSPDGTLASRIIEFSGTGGIVQAYNGQRLAIRITLDIDNGAGGYELRFYTGRTVDDEEHEWSPLGEPITGASTTSVFDATAGIELGDVTGITEDSMTGKLYAFKLLNGIGTAGTTAVSMSTVDASAGAASFSSGGHTWTASGGAALTDKHTRMAGEVPEWPAQRDLSGNDTVVTVAPTGVTRRMDAGSKPHDSGLLRYILSRDPVEFWPLTDGANALTGKNLIDGGQDMSTGLTNGAILPEWGKTELAPGIEPVFTAKKETSGFLRAKTRDSAAAAASWSVDYFVSTEAQGDIGTIEIRDRGAGTDADNLVYFQLTANQADDTIVIFRFSRGATSNSFALVDTINAPGIFDGKMHMVRFSMDPGASDTGWVLYVDGVAIGSGTVSSIVVKAVSQIEYTWSLETSSEQKADELIGFITYWDSSGPSAGAVWDAANGFPAERAGDRVQRIAVESGYTATVFGDIAYQRLMGLQERKKTLDLLNESATTDFGYLLDARDRGEVFLRSGSTLWNQHPALTLDFSAGLLAGYVYRDDDLLTENDVSVQRNFGGLPSRQILEEGTLSVQDPPDGVGRYDKSYTYSLSADSDAADAASMLLTLGTYDGIRYTRITLDLANERVYQMIDDILRTDVGDLIRLTDLPPEHGPDAVDSLVVGYSEEAGPTSWKITFICVPGAPFNGLLVEVAQRDRVDTAGCELAEALDETETGVDVLTTAIATWINASAVLNGNGSFDTGIAQWNAFGGASIAWDPTRGRPGGSPGCIALTTSGSSTPRGEGPRAAVVAGQQYVLSGWLYTDDTLGTTANVSVNWYTALSGGSYITTSNVTKTIVAGEWTYFQGTVTAPATSLGAGVLTSLSGTPTSGLIWRGDDLELRDFEVNSYPGDFPFDVRTGGEVMRVIACTGSDENQTFTVIRSINGVVKSHSAGQPVGLADPVNIPF